MTNKYKIWTIKDDTARGTNIACQFMNLKIDALDSCTSEQEVASRSTDISWTTRSRRHGSRMPEPQAAIPARN